jgi:hypothetical protein
MGWKVVHYLWTWGVIIYLAVSVFQIYKRPPKRLDEEDDRFLRSSLEKVCLYLGAQILSWIFF